MARIHTGTKRVQTVFGHHRDLVGRVIVRVIEEVADLIRASLNSGSLQKKTQSVTDGGGQRSFCVDWNRGEHLNIMCCNWRARFPMITYSNRATRMGAAWVHDRVPPPNRSL